MSAKPRTPKDSDFVDVIHSMYAPYVGVYRTDRYMSGHVKRFVGGQTHVVAQLDAAPKIIEQLLGAAAT
jgi:hypothetical protein